MITPIQTEIEDHPISYEDIGRTRGLEYRNIAYVAACMDFIALLLASLAGYSGYEYLAFRSAADPSPVLGIGLVLSTIFVLAMHSVQAYKPENIQLIRQQIRLTCVLIASTLAFLLTVIFFLKIGDAYSRGGTLMTAALSVCSLVALRVFWNWYLPSAAASASFKRKRVLLLCGQDFSIEQWRHLAAASGMTLAQTIRLSEDGSLPPSAMERLRQSQAERFDEVFIIWQGANVANLELHLAELRRSALPVNVIFDGVLGRLTNTPSGKIGGMTAFQTQRPPLNAYERGIKRAFDIAFSLAALLSLFPLLLVIAVAIKLDSPGPILFKQTRRGYGGRSFRILKFRSMSVMEDGDDIRQATRNDRRVTRVGAIIRAASIDELPQFWNVLRGDMSTVGPRPHALAHDELYDAQIVKYAYRRHVKPGLTGWAQINNCRGETPDIEKMEQRIFHDLWYINNWSFWLDLKIVFRTALQICDFGKVY
ncbi:polyprenyl glycosylphosphotransferase (plasmid) [Neorhizobium sp. SOG26]|uniref:exopolysaccharide biosynthesis polyprenyl glycosylphosphotransferase n=1 Tax=Neorhizobium sp. SOG26 TaxID=2060726 RepID=UPI000E5771FA|nr:exopolysaccharide biosynthesis polyprenyl glycosylphosphotransferase [Neorhizobium sp. SOG26]AXV17680.1 polyprenyl glycosylphosphotransferase [Neorhizobium sp. SOG26]